MNDHHQWTPLFVSLDDKYSHYGIIACVILEKIGEISFIDTWVMSCRVLKRGVLVRLIQKFPKETGNFCRIYPLEDRALSPIKSLETALQAIIWSVTEVNPSMVNGDVSPPKNKLTLQSVGWYITFGLIPFGSSLPGLFVLLVERIIRLFKPNPSPGIPISNPNLASWTNRIFLIFLGSMVLSGIFSPDPKFALLQTLGFAIMVYIFIFGGQTLGRSELLTNQSYLMVFMVTGFCAPLVAILRYFIFHMSRAENLPANSINGLGTILIITGGLVLGYLYWRGGKWRYLLIPYLGVTIAALLASKSRGGWFGFAGMLACFGLLNRKFRIFVIIIFIMVSLVFILSPTYQERFLNAFFPSKHLDRVHMIESTLHMIQDHPVFGIGAGVYPKVFPKYQIIDPRVVTENHPFAHNLLLQVAAEFGLVGFLIFFTMLGFVIFMSFKLARTSNHFYQGVFAVLIGVLIHQQVDLPIWGFDISGAFWLLIGLIIGLYQLEFGLNLVSKQ